MPDKHVPTIVTPPPNEPQPDREAQLDDSLSKLFEVDANSSPKVDNAVKESPKTNEPSKITEKKEPEKPKADTNSISEEKKNNPENNDSKPNKEGWKVLRESHAKAKKTLLEKDQELAKLKASLAEKGQVTSQEAESLKKEIEELKSYRAMVDIQADPEFLQKFDEPITKKTEHIHKMLSEWGVAEAIIQKIDYTDPSLIDKISDSIAEHKDKISAKKFLRYAEEINELYDKKTEHLDEYRKNYKNIVETKKKESFAKQAEQEGRMQKHLQLISEMKNENGEPRFEFLKEMVAKDPTNSAEVAQVEHQNKVYAMLRQQVEQAMKLDTPEDKVELAVAAAYARFSEAKFKAAMKKIESLQNELQKVSKVSNETPKAQRSKTSRSDSGQDNLDLDDALNNFMAANS